MANEFKVKNGIKFPDNSIQTTAATGGGAAVWFGDTAPGNTTTYPLWFDTSNPGTTPGGMTLYLYYNDGDSSQWVPADSNIASINPLISTDAGNLAVLGTDNGVLVDATHVTPAAIGAQATLVSATNIKTINSTSLLGSGDVTVQPTLVSATNIKTVNSTTLLGSGDLAVQATLVSGTSIKTINSTTLLGSGDIPLLTTTLTDGNVFYGNGSNVATSTKLSSAIVKTTSNTDVASPTPNCDTTTVYQLTAQAQTAAFQNPTGTPVDNQSLIIRIKDNGTARTLSWTAGYGASTDLALPLTTVLSKTLYLGFRWNAALSKWILLGKLDNIA